MKFKRFSIITLVTIFFFLLLSIVNQNIALTSTNSLVDNILASTNLRVTIDSPKDRSTISPIFNDMRGKYVGEIPSNHKLWILGKDQYNYFLMYPPPSIDISSKSWSQKNVRLSPGTWELHVCLGNSSGSNFLQDRANDGIFDGFSPLPDGIISIKYITVNVER